MSVKAPVVGLLGGGQLGRMLCEVANSLGIEIAILDTEDAPAKQINTSGNSISGSFKDPTKIRELAAHCDVLTFEIEHVDTAVLEDIDRYGVQVYAADGSCSIKKVAIHPSWKTLRLLQDKYEQKQYLGKQDIHVVQQLIVEPGHEMLTSMKTVSDRFGYPWMLKARYNSYDGRGNLKITSEADLESAATEFRNQLCYAERWMPFEMELAVVIIRTESDDGKMKNVIPYPPVETIHEDSTCSKVFMPPRGISSDTCKRAQRLACSVIEKLWGRGVFAVEMFLTEDEKLVVNEVAPRVHNSGHFSIESVPYMSQFKAQLVSILDGIIPERLAPHVSSSIMINILGGIKSDSHDQLVQRAKSMCNENMAVYIHLYGKESKPGRKIGHVTITGFISITELEKLAQPLLEAADEIRQERLHATAEVLHPQTALIPTVSATIESKAMVLVTMGSDSDLPVLKAGLDILDEFGVSWEIDITSAHRTPEKMAQVARQASAKGIKIIIAAAGGSAHLPGMIAAHTPLPVIGIPVKATHLDGLDSLLSIVQMPRGIPTATVAINNSTNAALLAIRCLGAFLPELHVKMKKFKLDMEEEVEEKTKLLIKDGVQGYLANMKKG